MSDFAFEVNIVAVDRCVPLMRTLHLSRSYSPRSARQR